MTDGHDTGSSGDPITEAQARVARALRSVHERGDAAPSGTARPEAASAGASTASTAPGDARHHQPTPAAAPPASTPPATNTSAPAPAPSGEAGRRAAEAADRARVDAAHRTRDARRGAQRVTNRAESSINRTVRSPLGGLLGAAALIALLGALLVVAGLLLQGSLVPFGSRADAADAGTQPTASVIAAVPTETPSPRAADPSSSETISSPVVTAVASPTPATTDTIDPAHEAEIADFRAQHGVDADGGVDSAKTPEQQALIAAARSGAVSRGYSLSNAGEGALLTLSIGACERSIIADHAVAAAEYRSYVTESPHLAELIDPAPDGGADEREFWETMMLSGVAVFCTDDVDDWSRGYAMTR